MGKIAIFEHLKSCSEAAKIFTGKLVGEVVQAVAAAIEELEQKVYKHGDTVSIPDGGTGGKSAKEALVNLGAAPLGHTHDSTEHIHFIRTLTADDDLDDIIERGIYFFNTDSIPAHCPYQNGGIIEVFGAEESVSVALIQRVTRIGAAGCSSFRGRYGNGIYTAWQEIETKGHTHNYIGYIKELTQDDDFDNVSESGIYFFNTGTIPKNCPYTNGGILEVFGAGSDANGKTNSTCYIQRVTRVGAAGQSSWRGHAAAGFTAWKEVALSDHSHTASDVGAATSDHIHYVRQLTSADNMNNITSKGVYYYSTGNVPSNAPYQNAAIVEVFGTNNDTSATIQRVTRYGEGGHTSIRSLSGGTWMDWQEFASNFIRRLTSSDDLDKITDKGVYDYATSSIPKNCPFTNAGIVEVVGNKTGGALIQRITRFGLDGYSSFRGYDSSSGFTPWQSVITPRHICGGLVSVNVSAANTPTLTTVNFTPTMASAPAVTVTPNSNTPQYITGCGVRNSSTSSCQIYVTRSNTSLTDVNYTAIAMTL